MEVGRIQLLGFTRDALRRTCILQGPDDLARDPENLRDIVECPRLSTIQPKPEYKNADLLGGQHMKQLLDLAIMRWFRHLA